MLNRKYPWSMITGPPIESVTLEAADLPYTLEFGMQNGRNVIVQMEGVGGDIIVEASLFEKLPQGTLWHTIYAANTVFGTVSTTTGYCGALPLVNASHKFVIDAFGVGTTGTALTIHASYTDEGTNWYDGFFGS